MAKLIYAINITLDGCCDHTKGTAGEDIHEYFTNLLRTVDTLVYGRITYQLMVPFWPDVAKNNSGPTASMNAFAKAFDAVSRIVVFSKTLEKAEGKNTRIVRANLQEEILKLKQEQGKDILLGGVALPEQLIKLDLIDEYNIVVHPVIAGEGRRLLDGVSLQDQLQLKLIDSTNLRSGHVALRYRK
jgi:dihydrofolate reductase